MLKLANRSRDNYNFFQLHPAEIVDILVENFSFPAINVTSIHVIGWVLPLCREIWFQMRWSNFEKNMHSFASFLGEFFTIFWILTGFSSFLLEPVHSSESECTGWTNRRIDLTKYHTARALEKLIWFKTVLEKRLYWETMTRAEWNHAFTQDHTMKTKSEQVGCQSPWVFCTCIQYGPISTARQSAKVFIPMNITLLHFVCPSEGYYYYYYYYYNKPSRNALFTCFYANLAVV